MNPDSGASQLILEAGAAIIALLLALAFPQLGEGLIRPVQAWAGRLALLPIAPILQTAYHDEFSFLLAGDEEAPFWCERFLVCAWRCSCCKRVGRQPTTDLPRTQVRHFLERQPGRQLAIVRYDAGPDTRNEWVYNAADIGASQVIWARDMGPEDNRELLEYYQDREVWLVNADQTPPRVLPYPANAGASGQQ